MKSILPFHLDKIWGWEKWIYSPLKSRHSRFAINNQLIPLKGPLIKIIFAKNPLSIQVHPSDELAKKFENESNGKAECWYVLKTDNDIQQVQIGLKNYDLKILREHLENNQLEQDLHYQTIKPGDFIDVPAGVVHGICGGTTVLEMQQPSDITYRLYDFHRQQKDGSYRELHVEKGLSSIKNLPWNLAPFKKNPLTYKNQVGTLAIYRQQSIVEQSGIVINLEVDSYNTFWVDAKEEIKFKYWAFCPIK